MSTASELITKAKNKAADHLSRSNTAVHLGEVRYGWSLGWRSTTGGLEHRSDENGNLPPYLPDDDEVLQTFFHLRASEWENAF